MRKSMEESKKRELNLPIIADTENIIIDNKEITCKEVNTSAHQLIGKEINKLISASFGIKTPK